MPSESRASRSISPSRSPPRRSDKRREYADDEDRSAREGKNGGYSGRDRRQDSDSRRRSRYDDDEEDDRRDRKGSRRDDRGRGRSYSRSRSPPRKERSERDRDSHDDSSRRADRSNNNMGRSTGALPSQSSALATAGVPEGKKFGKKQSRSPSPSAEALEAAKPNFGNSGALAAETNTFKGVVLKYNEPPEARKPNKGWRLYVFKGKEQVDMIHVNRQSAYLFGRDKVVVDIPIEHPSASKQHAVLQYRQVHERNEFGDTKSVTKPYLIDLDSANGTTVNEQKIPPSRYYELQPNDLIKFAYSTRECKDAKLKAYYWYNANSRISDVLIVD